ncbi:hypothetical protein Nepgr_012905 [Nepenthes gracilis]|uniref:E2 ubiquitin-conjugating enzyme n=1 Tax=Nepenthes gracilis TaxID=150966 RepID=A0AAD3SI30_NEPGR|nr:hypothetical protein Nepgr_012905 [Nepenthes gracilis]
MSSSDIGNRTKMKNHENPPSHDRIHSRPQRVQGAFRERIRQDSLGEAIELGVESSNKDMEMDDFGVSSSSESFIAKKLKQNEDDFTNDPGVSATVMVTVDSVNLLKSSISESNDSIDHNGSNSDISYHDDGNDDGDDFGSNADDASDYDDNTEYLYDEDNYLKLQAQFDNVDLPPGVEASVPWMQHPGPSEIQPPYTGSSTSSNGKGSAASSSKVAAESTSNVEKEELMDDVLRKLMYFKQFDVVEDFSDHHYVNEGFSGQELPKSWVKKVQDEWKILEKNLPDTIFVRVYETRMDLLRAVIIGPAGTPYHDGLFFFDAVFPPSYPSVPPMVYYYSGGLRLNPNLYECGKVCLSLLGTWSGKKTEMWIPDHSTMLQVLVSVQALILNVKPFFNEPGYENMYRGEEGERKSKSYNEDVFLLSLKTMTYTLKRPPKHFEDFIAGHFRVRAHDILTACKAYCDGAEVGCNIRNRFQYGGYKEGDSGSEGFKAAITRTVKGLTASFIKNGSKDCGAFETVGQKSHSV